LTAKLDSRPANFQRSAIILGNGPSIRGIELNQFKNQITIGMNAAYRYWKTLGWYPTYYCCLDTVVIESHAKDIYCLIKDSKSNGIKLFFLQRNIARHYPDLYVNPKVIWFDDVIKDHPFSDFKLVTTGAGSALFAMALGFRRLCLLGVDCNYVERIDEALALDNNVLEMSATPERNPNYFFDSYQIKGDKFNIPNSLPDLHVSSWSQVNKLASQHGAEIINCNRESNVRVFPFDDWINIKHNFTNKRPVSRSRDKSRISIDVSSMESFIRNHIDISNDSNIKIKNLSRNTQYVLVLVVDIKEAPLLPVTFQYKIDGRTKYCSVNANSTPYVYFLEIHPRWFKSTCTIEISNTSEFTITNQKGSNRNGNFILFRLAPGELAAMPSPLFDAAQYLLDHPDVSKAVVENDISSAYLHYVLYGHDEGRRVLLSLDLSSQKGTALELQITKNN
jgi:hypothetical protein